MRIASVNAAVTGGGAEFVARSLHEQYRALGHDAWLLVGSANAPAPATIAIPNDRYRSAWARPLRRVAAAAGARSARTHDAWWYADRAVRSLAEPLRYARVARGHEDFSAPATRHVLELTPQPPEVLHLHNLHGSYFDIRELPALTRRATTVLTLHDAWALTGHCAHPIECDGYLTGCEHCPHLDRYVSLRRDAAADNFALKRRALAESRIAFAAPSAWMLGLAEKSGALASATGARVIPNGIDTAVFTPGSRDAARARLGLPADTLIFAAAARGFTDNPFKGFDVLEAALASAGESGMRALVLALGEDAPARHYGDIELRFVPFVDDASLMAEYYRAADALVHPSRAEALGLVLLEAAACGIPVVAADVGGIPEVVRDGTGVLFPAGDGAALAEVLGRLADEPARRAAMGARAAELAAERYSLRTQANAYLAWFEELRTADEEGVSAR